MSILKPINKAKYNSEPISYCSEPNCLSLKVMIENNICYCGKCGSLEIKEAKLEDWEVLYENHYKKKHL